jgi:hypothetical protein
MTYPPEHYEIVKALLSEGRFLLEGEAAFLSLRENKDFYTKFFHESFRLDVSITADYALLKSSKDADNVARSICVYLAILCYELDQPNGKIVLSNLLTTMSWKLPTACAMAINAKSSTNCWRGAGSSSGLMTICFSLHQRTATFWSTRGS